MKRKIFSVVVAVFMVLAVLPLSVSASGAGCLEIKLDDLIKSDGAESLENGVLTYGRPNYGHVYVYFNVPDGFSLADYDVFTLTVEGISGDLEGKNVNLKGGMDITGGWFHDNDWNARRVAMSTGADIHGVHDIVIPLEGDLSAFDGVTRYALYIHAQRDGGGSSTSYSYKNIWFRAKGCARNCITCDPSGTPAQTQAAETPSVVENNENNQAGEEPAEVTAPENETAVPETSGDNNVSESGGDSGSNNEPGLLGLAIGAPVFGVFSGIIAARKPKRYG
jgi:hypothetical protein